MHLRLLVTPIYMKTSMPIVPLVRLMEDTKCCNSTEILRQELELLPASLVGPQECESLLLEIGSST